MAEETESGPLKAKIRATNDIYTAMLGLAVLTLAATVAFICIYSYKMFGTIFGNS